jgi:hypothetical protein
VGGQWRGLPGEGGVDGEDGLHRLLGDVVGQLAAGVAAGRDVAVGGGDSLAGSLAGGGLLRSVARQNALS